ncbi:MAG: beta-propeller domain-containing protein [bacterium]
MIKRIKKIIASIFILSCIFFIFSGALHAQFFGFDQFITNTTNTNIFTSTSWPLFQTATTQPVNSLLFINSIFPQSPFPQNTSLSSLFPQTNQLFSNWPVTSITPITFPTLSTSLLPSWFSPFDRGGWNWPQDIAQIEIEQVINESFDEQSIYLTQGNLIRIELTANPSTGYQWQGEWDKSKLSLHDHFNIIPSSVGLLGASGKEVWIFKALALGKTEISFEYKRPWNFYAAPLKELVFTIIIHAEGSMNDLVGKDSDFVSAGTESPVYGAYGSAMYSANATAAPEAALRDDQAQIAREIEEADIIKIEGTYLYLLNRYRGLIICNIANPRKPSMEGRTPIPSGDPKDMYIDGTRAYIIVNSVNSELSYTTDLFDNESASDPFIPPSQQSSSIVIVNISNKSNPHVITTIDVEGTVTDSRIVGNILYVVSSEYPLYYYAQPLPVAVLEGTTTSTAPVDIAVPLNVGIGEAVAIEVVAGEGVAVGSMDSEMDESIPERTEHTIHVTSIDISSAANTRVVDRLDFIGYTNYIHVTDKAIFIESYNNSYRDASTTITFVDISDHYGAIEERGSVQIPGSVKDKFKMDYYDGYLRVCTYKWDNEGGVSILSIIDVRNPDRLNVVSEVPVGRGEQLFATRFDGERGYLVTFERIDPLWVIDLSNPREPRIEGELEIPGWSTHIEPRGERLIALGVDDTIGRKVSVSLFDVSDMKDPQLMRRVSFGEGNGWSSSTAYGDVKALTVIDDSGLILLPYSTSVTTGGRYTQDHRLQLIDFSYDDIEARGWVSQKGSVQRSRNIANYLFSVSLDELQVIDATNRDKPEIISSLPLARNSIDFVALNNGYGVHLTTDDYSSYSLSAVPLSDPEDGTVISRIDLDAQSTPSLIANGNMVYVIMTEYNTYYPYGVEPAIPVVDIAVNTMEVSTEPAEPSRQAGITTTEPMVFAANPVVNSTEPSVGSTSASAVSPSVDIEAIAPPEKYYPVAMTTVQIYDFSTITRPRKRGFLEVPGTYYGLRARGEALPVHSSSYSNYNIIQIASDVLVFNKAEPYYYGDRYYIAAEGPTDDSADMEEFRGLLVVDLSNPDKPELAAQVPYGDINPRSLFAEDEILYYSYSRDIKEEDQKRPQSKYYLARVNLADPSHPYEFHHINIPGYCVGLNNSGEFAYTINIEWSDEEEDSWYQDYSFNVVKIVDDTAYLFDTIPLDGQWYNTIIDSGYAYLSGSGGYVRYYDSMQYGAIRAPYYGGYGEFIIIDLSNPENLVEYKHSPSGGSFDIFAARNHSLFARVNGGLACYDVADPEHPNLEESRQGYSSTIVFLNNKAYLPLGYYGLWVKGL